MTDRVTITVSGPTGSGKSGVAAEIAIALQAQGLHVEWASPADEEAARAETWAQALGRWTTLDSSPSVVIEEQNIPRKAPA